jgi:hypothetical protein
MTRRFSGYSENHDRSTKKKVERKSSVKSTKEKGQFPTPSIEAQPTTLSDSQRRALRVRQLMERTANPDPDLKPLPDPDLTVQSPRGDQGNMVDGRTVFPMVDGPQFRTRTRVLRGDPDLREAAQEQSPIPEASHEDKALLRLDDSISAVHTQLINLRNSVTDCQSIMRDRQLTEIAEISQILSTAIEPWFLLLEEKMENLIKKEAN